VSSYITLKQLSTLPECPCSYSTLRTMIELPELNKFFERWASSWRTINKQNIPEFFVKLKKIKKPETRGRKPCRKLV